MDIDHKEGATAYITLRNPSGGWPRVFDVRTTAVKCLVCDELANDGFVVCQPCRAAVQYVRTSINNKTFLHLKEVLEHPRLELFLDVASRLTEDALAEALAKAFYDRD